MNVTIIGAGVMGRGIALATAIAGGRVVLVDNDENARAAVRALLEESILLVQLMSDRSKTPVPPKESLLELIVVSGQVRPEFAQDFIIECITEDVRWKRHLYETLETACGRQTIIASNTSCIPIGAIAQWTQRPDMVIGTHFMNPAYASTCVEVVRGAQTSPAVVERTNAFVGALGKSSIVVGDGPGFVINRVLMGAINQAVGLLDERVATAEQIDNLFVNCLGHKMGPLATADLIGLDVVMDSLLVLKEYFQLPQFEPNRVLRQHVEEGNLGYKTGRGFFSY